MLSHFHFSFPFLKSKAMFGNDKIAMNNLSSIRATSKLSLKLSCLAISNGDLDKATKMYEFFAKDMELPDKDPVPPSKFEAIKHSVNEVGGLIKDNKDDIMDLANFIMGLIGKKSTYNGRKCQYSTITQLKIKNHVRSKENRVLHIC